MSLLRYLVKKTLKVETTDRTDAGAIPATLLEAYAIRFWFAAAGIGCLTGLSAGLLTKLLEWVQIAVWGGNGRDLLSAVQRSTPLHIVEVLLLAGVATALAQLALRRLSSGNEIDTTAAIWFHAGRVPAIRTLGSATLSVILVGMGVSLGREGAPKQAGAVFSNLFSNWTGLSDNQRRVLVACGAGAGLAAAYGVPVGGALFAIEVVRGALALRFILPALLCSAIATSTAWLILPNQRTYHIPAYPDSLGNVFFAIFCGIAGGLFAVIYVRAIRWAERNKPSGWKRLVRPMLCLSILGCAAICFPELLGNGHDVSQLIFSNSVSFSTSAWLCLLKPVAIVLCIWSGTPGGLFTPSLTSGALLGSVLGVAWRSFFPEIPIGLCGYLGAGAMLSATTQGPISSLVLLIELTGEGRPFLLPLVFAVAVATLIARSVDHRSVYDAKLSDEQIATRQRLRDRVQFGPEV